MLQLREPSPPAAPPPPPRQPLSHTYIYTHALERKIRLLEFLICTIRFRYVCLLDSSNIKKESSKQVSEQKYKTNQSTNQPTNQPLRLDVGRPLQEVVLHQCLLFLSNVALFQVIPTYKRKGWTVERTKEQTKDRRNERRNATDRTTNKQRNVQTNAITN